MVNSPTQQGGLPRQIHWLHMRQDHGTRPNMFLLAKPAQQREGYQPKPERFRALCSRPMVPDMLRTKRSMQPLKRELRPAGLEPNVLHRYRLKPATPGWQLQQETSPSYSSRSLCSMRRSSSRSIRPTCSHIYIFRCSWLLPGKLNFVGEHSQPARNI